MTNIETCNPLVSPALNGMIEINRRMSRAPVPDEGPPKKEKPATVAAAAGSELVCENATKSPYQLLIAPATVNERQAWHAVRFFNGAPKLTREARRVGMALVILARAVRSGEASGEQIAQEAGLSVGKTVAGLHALASEGLIARTPRGFALKWESLQ